MKKPSWTNRFTKPLAALLGVVALLTLAACGGGGTGGTSPNTPTGTLGVSPATIVMDFGAPPVTLVVSGGVKPYALTSSLPDLIPVINSIPEDGRFVISAAYMPAFETLVTLTIRDAAQSVTTAQVTVNAKPGVALAVSPTAADSGINVPVTFTITGGTTPYTVTSSQPSIVPNPIAVDAQGRFTVTAISNPTAATAVVLSIRDARNATVSATLNVRSLALAVSPTSAATAIGVPVAYQISGGVAPYTVISSNPTIVPDPTVNAGGRFTITPVNNLGANYIGVTILLTVRDSAGSQVTSQLQILSTQLSVSPTDVQVAANVPVTFTISGGSTPYTVVSSQPSLVPNPVSIDTQGRFTLRATSTPSQTTNVLVTVRDAAQTVVTATMTVLAASPVPLSVLPTTAIVYNNTPAVLTILGGTPPYQAFSSNSVVLPVARNVVGDQVLLAPANVDADTTVTITVTDSSSTSVTAQITVKPAPLLNTLTITPTPASPGVGCGTAVCAGQTGSVTVLVRNLAGAGIQGRAVRFENVQGNYQFFTSGPGQPETFANSITVTTGQDGLAVVRLKADVNAPTQVALIRATELTTGNVLNSSFVIAQFTDGTGTLTAIPTTWTITGPTSTTCGANLPVTYYIFGGTPPYRIQSTLPNFANIVPSLVQTNGGGFTAIVTGTVCTTDTGAQFTITDATGRTIAVTLINKVGSANPVTNYNEIQMVPGDIATPLGCGQSVTEQIVGGEIRMSDGTLTQPSFVVSTLGPNVTATLNGRTITVTRSAYGTATSPAIIYVSNGVRLTSFQVAVATSCAGGGTDTGGVIEVSPSPLPLACANGSAALATISWPPGINFVSAVTLGPLTAVLNGTGNILTVTRTAGVSQGSPSIPILLTNGVATTTLMVAPTGTCP